MIFFFFILNLFSSFLGIQEEKYKFKKEFISSIRLGSRVSCHCYSFNETFNVEMIKLLSVKIRPPPSETIFHPLMKLSHQDRANLCKFAQKLTRFDSMEEEAFTRLFFPYTYHITFADESMVMDVAIWCWTVPKFYLRFGDSITDVRIILRKNEFSSLLYRFHIQIIRSTPSSLLWAITSEKRFSKARNLSRLIRSLIVPLSVQKYLKSRFHKSKKYESITWRELVQHDRISWLHNYERLYICFTAKRYVENDEIPVLKSSSTGFPKVYQFLYPDRTQELHIAFKCPSTPIMYACFGETDYDIHIMLLQNEVSIFGVGSPIDSD